jgi:hypothetical protein
MKKSIQWIARGSDTVHTIPEGAYVGFCKDAGMVVVGFSDDDEVEYLKKPKGDAKEYKGWLLLPGEYGSDPGLKAFVRVMTGKDEMMQVLTPILDGMKKEEAVESSIRVIDELCERYLGVTEVFPEGLRMQDKLDKAKE